MAAALKAMGKKPLLDGALKVTLKAFMPIPSSFGIKKRNEALLGMLRPAVRPDIDNIEKAIYDGAGALECVDDELVQDAHGQ